MTNNSNNHSTNGSSNLSAFKIMYNILIILMISFNVSDSFKLLQNKRIRNISRLEMAGGRMPMVPFYPGVVS